MSLSEREERLLTQMERELRAEDPRFTARMDDSISRRRRRRRIRSGAIVITAGLILILLSVWHNTIWPGTLGILTMLAGAGWATGPLFPRPAAGRGRRGHPGPT
ncbi:DUF3040 domain-containing protein [Intrasporangium sp.]|uniref:DUF3040 domain-containing protein n=1 Tax=Intrasporangium sp. TaxID=1925024 RepID=UPI003221D075